MKPAVLFLVFNRPDTTARVFEAIRHAKPPRLYVAADGPRPQVDGESDRCRDVRRIILDIDWPCQVKTLFFDTNLGCRNAVSTAITWFFENEEEGIILEDDCLPHPSFFTYCSDLLAKYRNVESVMSISGSCFARRPVAPNSYSFTYYADMWGWATWRRAWKNYDISMKSWISGRHILAERFSMDSNQIKYWSYFFDSVAAGKIDTWDYQWIWSVIRENGLCITPHENMIRNLGIGVDATHTTDSSWAVARRKVRGSKVLRHPSNLIRNKSLERDIALARLGIVPHDWNDKFRLLITDLTTYSSSLIVKRKIRELYKRALPDSH